MDWEYVAIDVPPARLAEFVAGIEGAEFAGVNVTIPHKLAVIPMCAEIAPEARAAGSVNTLLVRDGAVHGHSTDGRGLLWALGDAPRRDEPHARVGVFQRVGKLIDRAGRTVLPVRQRAERELA